MTTTNRADDVGQIIATAKLAVEPRVLDVDVDYAVVQAGSVVHLNLGLLRSRPRRPSADIQVLEADSLIRYVSKVHDRPEEVRLYGDPEGKQVTAILNDHAQGAPGWRDHRVTLFLADTPAWKLWHGSDRKELAQVKFAELVEEGQPEIVRPDAADMLELAMRFEATTKVQFKSGIRLASGERQLTYVEEQDQGAEKRLVMPERFTLRLQVFVTDEEGGWHDIECRLRYRIDSGTLKITYLMDRPELVVRRAFLDELRKVEAGTKAQAVVGTPGE